MSTERMKILEMLKDGKISAEDADRLIERIERLDEAEDEVSADNDDIADVHDRRGINAAVAEALKTAAATGRSARATIRTVRERHSSKGGKFFCIKIQTHKGKNINLRLPLAVAKAGVKLSALLPQSATDSLKEKGINLDELTQLKGDDLSSAIEELDLNIETEEGDTIRIFCE
jgi:uncharacterized protein (UPF0335 family)